MPSSRDERQSNRFSARVLSEIAVAAAGTALLLCAVLANQQWLDRHLFPSWFVPHHWWVSIESSARAVLAVVGMSLALWLRPRLGGLIASPSRAVALAVAAFLGLGAGELVLRQVQLRPVGWLVPDEEEPRRRPDPRLGWSLLPARTGHSTVAGRVIDYSIDAAGYRVRRVDEPVDPEQPTIVFIGESVMFGEGLTSEESVPAQVGAMMGIQSANLAVHGFSSDQAYLRLETELPRFRRPVAVVALFMPALFGRNLDDNRPRLGPGLTWLPPEQHGKLASLVKLLVPYRKTDTVERGVAMTREVLGATVNLAGARGARALIVVPQFGVEEQAERAIRRRILDETGLPYAFVEIDEDWRLSWALHPNPRAARVIATAVAAHLQRHFETRVP